MHKSVRLLLDHGVDDRNDGDWPTVNIWQSLHSTAFPYIVALQSNLITIDQPNMKYLTIVALLLCSTRAMSQSQNVCQTIEASTKGSLSVHSVVEVMPKYKCGKSCTISYLLDHIKYKPKHSVCLMIDFVVNPDSTISNVNVWRPKVEGLEEHVSQVMSEMKWTPGQCDDQAVPVKIFMPLTIRGSSR